MLKIDFHFQPRWTNFTLPSEIRQQRKAISETRVANEVHPTIAWRVFQPQHRNRESGHQNLAP